MKIFFILSITILLLTSIKGQVKVGNNPNSINSNSILELESTNKGLLLPRVALSATTNTTPLSAHTAGMIIYNTSTSNDVVPGYYYNNGTQWIKIGNSKDEAWYGTDDNKPANLNTENIYSMGKVGIGTNSPSKRLSLYSTYNNGSDIISETDASRKIKHWFKNGSINWSIGTPGSTAAPSNGFMIKNETVGRTDFTITRYGKIGIGTVFPSELLDINGKTKTTSIQITNGATSGYILQSDANGNASWVSPSSIGSTGGDLETDRIFIGHEVRNVLTQYSFGSYSGNKGIKLTTRIPNDNNQKRHKIIIEGGHTGGTIPITFEVSFRLNNGAFTETTCNIRSSHRGSNISHYASPRVKIGTENGFVVLYIEHDNTNYMFYYNFTVHARFNSYTSQIDQTWYDNWSISRIYAAAPSSTYLVPIGTNFGGVLSTNELRVYTKDYSTISNGASSPVPTGGPGTIIYRDNHFFGWNGSTWKQLDN